jgi:hypothetical protein
MSHMETPGFNVQCIPLLHANASELLYLPRLSASLRFVSLPERPLRYSGLRGPYGFRWWLLAKRAESNSAEPSHEARTPPQTPCIQHHALCEHQLQSVSSLMTHDHAADLCSTPVMQYQPPCTSIVLVTCSRRSRRHMHAKSQQRVHAAYMLHRHQCGLYIDGSVCGGHTTCWHTAVSR